MLTKLKINNARFTIEAHKRSVETVEHSMRNVANKLIDDAICSKLTSEQWAAFSKAVAILNGIANDMVEARKTMSEAAAVLDMEI